MQEALQAKLDPALAAALLGWAGVRAVVVPRAQEAKRVVVVLQALAA
jgi:hypothetical protein